MKIKQDPVTKLWCREDGAILLPPCRNIRRFPYTWSFGYKHPTGYRLVGYKGRMRYVHPIVCRAFNGLPPEGKSEVDHKNRIRDDNSFGNLHWVSRGENMDNTCAVDRSVEKYGIRYIDDPKGYMKAYNTGRTYHKDYAAKKRAQGLTYRKGPDGKFHWLPCIRTKPAV